MDTAANDERFMRRAYLQAHKGYTDGGCPIGAVLVDAASGAVLGEGHNMLVQEGNPILHGEMAALRAAGRMTNRHGTVLYTTLQPCFMCAGTIAQFGIPRVVIGDTVNAGSDETILFLRARGIEVTVLDPARSAAERAIALRCPLVCFSATGGARMQESLFSLMQMAKTSAALGRMRAAGLPYVSVLTHPTTGGVSASLGMLGDINVGEPQALIGFAGPRVIEQTVRETLPEGFQRSEFLVDHGAVDLIIDRRQMREKLAAMLAILSKRPAPAPSAAVEAV